MAKISCPLGGRDIDEWIGSSPNAKIPDRVRNRVFIRAKGICYLAKRKILTGEKWELEHVIPLSMGGEHRESNLRPALKVEHKIKTAAEATERAKADRIRRKHNGTWSKPKQPFPKRKFNSSRAIQSEPEE